MNKERLLVYFERELVGQLNVSSRSEFLFQYSSTWLASDRSFAISLSLPLTSKQFTEQAAHYFFANLLPEGIIRQLVARRLGISEDNDVALLRALGGECAGALTIVSEEPSPPNKKYREISKSDLEQFAEASSVLPLVVDGQTVRLSLAGAQDKLPVMRKDGKFFIPLNNAPSTHLLKFGNRDFSHLPENEVFTTLLARQLNLPVAAAELYQTKKAPICVVERYDRVREPRGTIRRLHQEDFCQALGLSSKSKYQKEGGPTFAQCFEVVSRHTVDPTNDAEALLRWLIFNVLVANADAHAKNLSLLMRPDRTITLAPFYDLVCTGAYPQLDRYLAMQIGSTSDPGQVGIKDWQLLSSEIKVGPKFLISMVEQMSDAINDGLKNTLLEFKTLYGDNSFIVSSVAGRIRQQVRRTRQLLGGSKKNRKRS